jgi:hypothetical protein
MENLNNKDKTSENAEKELRISDLSCCKNCKNLDIIDFGWFRCNLTKELINEDDICDSYQPVAFTT